MQTVNPRDRNFCYTWEKPGQCAAGNCGDSACGGGAVSSLPCPCDGASVYYPPGYLGASGPVPCPVE